MSVWRKSMPTKDRCCGALRGSGSHFQNGEIDEERNCSRNNPCSCLGERRRAGKSTYERSADGSSSNSCHCCSRKRGQPASKNAGWSGLQEQNAGEFLFSLQLLLEAQHQSQQCDCLVFLASSGFNKVSGYESRTSQIAFYNSDRTILIIVTGKPGAAGEDTDAYSVAYERYQPGLSEKTVTSLTQGKISCN